MWGGVWLRFRILSVFVFGALYFLFDVIEGALIEIRFDEFASIFLAVYAVWALVWRISDSTLRPKGIVIAMLYVGLAFSDLFIFASGSSGDELLLFFLTFVLIPVLLFPSLWKWRPWKRLA
jgi:hypothetical protein